MIKLAYISKVPFSSMLTQRMEGESGIEIMGRIYLTENTIEITKDLNPQVVALDTDSMSINETAQTILHLKEMMPEVKIITLVNTSEPVYCFHIIEAGGDSIIEKHSEILADDVMDNIQSVQNAHFAMPQTLIGKFIERLDELKHDNYDFFQKRLTAIGAELSVKEAEVAYYLRQNLKNREIAVHLEITEGTVKVHISNIYRKLNIKGRKNVVEYLERVMSNSSGSDRILEHAHF
ncbi:helix-turn-helix transcriptional regulator [Oceanobacillus longus]|uniref:Helix-turn-helix transcriptional regulator n=1 Tax=Oceanobacillus longus TaxID=930120 RepID=A0ABV8H2N6_9BACI